MVDAECPDAKTDAGPSSLEASRIIRKQEPNGIGSFGCTGLERSPQLKHASGIATPHRSKINLANWWLLQIL